MVKKIYLYAAVITTLIFVVGIVTGYYMSRMEIRGIEDQLYTNQFEMKSLDMELKVLENLGSESACEYLKERLPDLARKKTKLANQFQRVSEESAEVLEKEFAFSLVRYWLFMKIQGEKCDIDKPIVLFFHKKGEELSRQQGVVLDYWVYKLREHNESLSVFSFGVGLKESLVDLLKDIYDIDKTPSIVVKEKTYSGLKNREKVKEILCDNYNLTIC